MRRRGEGEHDGPTVRQMTAGSMKVVWPGSSMVIDLAEPAANAFGAPQMAALALMALVSEALHGTGVTLAGVEQLDEVIEGQQWDRPLRVVADLGVH